MRFLSRFLHCLLLFIPFAAAAQLNEKQLHYIDSLKQVIGSDAHDTLKIMAYGLWDDAIYMSDSELDRELCLKMAGLLEKNINLASADKSLVRRLKMKLGGIYNNLGIIYYAEGSYARAIDYYTRSMKIREVLDKPALAGTLGNIGNIYYMQGDHVKAKQYYQQGLKIAEEVQNKASMANCLLCLGNISNVSGDKEKAMYYYNRSLDIQKKMGNQRSVANSLVNIAALYLDRKDPATSLEFSRQCINIYQSLGDKSGLATAYLTLADGLNTLGNSKEAIDYVKLAQALANEVNSIQLKKESSELLYKLYRSINNFEEALHAHELYMAIKDSIQNEEGKKEMLRQELKYNYEKQKVLDEKENEKKIALASEKEKKQKLVNYFVTLGLLLVLLFSVFVVNRLRLTRKQKMIIENQKELVEEKQKEILDSISYAKRLQEAILPPDRLFRDKLPDSFIYYCPKDIVAGDFYWMETAGDSIFVAAADCTGHGVPGALVSVVCSNALNRSVLEFGLHEPGKILDKTRELVLDTFSKSDTEVKDGMDISLAALTLQENGRYKVQWAGANNPLWYTQNSEMKELIADKQPIGKTDNPRPFHTHTLLLQKGDSLYLFTDGYADQFGGEKGKKFKYKPLRELLHSISSFSPGDQKEKLSGCFTAWRGNLEQVDDVCVIGIRL